MIVVSVGQKAIANLVDRNIICFQFSFEILVIVFIACIDHDIPAFNRVRPTVYNSISEVQNVVFHSLYPAIIAFVQFKSNSDISSNFTLAPFFNANAVVSTAEGGSIAFCNSAFDLM